MKDLQKFEPPEIVEQIIADALSQSASDIYILPQKEFFSIRFRINGVQSEYAELPSDLGIQCISRIKVLAGMLTYRSKIAQDGVIRKTEQHNPDISVPQDAELRVAVMPTSTGERITIRILNRQQENLLLENLSLAENVQKCLKNMLKRPDGMIILTGPTGSGKTTTIYAMIRELLRDQQDPASIISIEDPVECEIKGISQVSVTRSDEDWGYPQALKASLRQDVKTLIIGEMRDKEIVRVALDASLTGHRVITTFHAGDIPAVYTRMLHHGFEPFLVASAITGIVSQRLVRRKDGDGRIPVVACLQPADEWRELIMDNPGLCELRDYLKNFPEADINSVARKMADENLIYEKDVYLL